jgi:hypothetical protein
LHRCLRVGQTSSPSLPDRAEFHPREAECRRHVCEASRAASSQPVSLRVIDSAHITIRFGFAAGGLPCPCSEILFSNADDLDDDLQKSPRSASILG